MHDDDDKWTLFDVLFTATRPPVTRSVLRSTRAGTPLPVAHSVRQRSCSRLAEN